MQGPQGTYVYRLTADDKAEVAPVKTGPTVGAGWIVEEGLKVHGLGSSAAERSRRRDQWS